MQNHTKIYLSTLGFSLDDNSSYVPSEISEERAVDIHHIISRGKKGEDRIENLMALTRLEHTDFGDKKKYMVILLKIHRAYLRNNNVPYCNDWFNTQIHKYEKGN